MDLTNIRNQIKWMLVHSSCSTYEIAEKFGVSEDLVTEIQYE